MKYKKISFLLFAVMFLSAGRKANAQSDSVIYAYTGAVQTWTVPCGVDSVSIDCFGAQGIGVANEYYPGYGGEARGVLGVSPGQVLNLYVGGQSLWNGGGSGQNGANGGDGSDVRVGGNALANRAIVAGGGGGAGGDSWQCTGSVYANGGGGTPVGSNFIGGGGGEGYTFGSGCGGNGATNGGAGGGGGCHGGGGGGGGMSSGGGGATATCGPYTAGSGSLGLGGAAYSASGCNYEGAGGGGGGYYGGGGAVGYNCGAGQGGGGSSWTGSLAHPYFNSGSWTGVGQIILRWNKQMAVKVIGNEACIGDSTGKAYVTASFGVPPYTYSWSNGNTTDTISRVTAGTYTITVTDNNGCVATASATITQPSALLDSAFAFGYIRCHGNATGHAFAKVSGGTTPYTYSWMPSGGTKDTALGLSAGTYTLTVTDPCKDTAIAMVTVTQPASVLVGASQTTDILCFRGSNGQAKAVAIGGWGNYSYLWSNGATTATATGLVAGTYTVHVRDSSGCRDSVTVVVVQPAALALHSASTPDVGSCNGTAWIIVTGGTAPYSYFWSDGSTTDTVTGECTGNYCCSVTDSHGCFNRECIIIQSSQGVQNINNLNEIKIYPNPNTGHFTISGIANGEIIEVYNYMGQMLYNKIAGNTNTMQFDISSNSSGVYLVKIESQDGKLITEKQIIKQ